MNKRSRHNAGAFMVAVGVVKNLKLRPGWKWLS
jgi:hypothetical protein